MTLRPDVKGWCPGAYRPMMSGDGLIVRVRPYHARLDRRQTIGLCNLAQMHGSGIIELTNRANLQIRGVQETNLDDLIAGLAALDLLDATPEIETRRNLLVTPFWQQGDLCRQISQRLLDALPDMPLLPAKFGFAIDAGPTRVLDGASGDIRIEMARDGLIVRADGAQLGRLVDVETVVTAICDLADWFVAHRQDNDRRMTHVLTHHALPTPWQTHAPRHKVGARPAPGLLPLGRLLGAPFGQMDARALGHLIAQTPARGIRVTPWRMFLLESDVALETDAFVTRAEDPLMRIDACPGAPFCASATVETRAVARTLAPHLDGSLHISGCAKGCARKNTADMTLTGRNARFDLVVGGHAWDAPQKSGLAPSDLLTELTSAL